MNIEKVLRDVLMVCFSYREFWQFVEAFFPEISRKLSRKDPLKKSIADFIRLIFQEALARVLLQRLLSERPEHASEIQPILNTVERLLAHQLDAILETEVQPQSTAIGLTMPLSEALGLDRQDGRLFCRKHHYWRRASHTLAPLPPSVLDQIRSRRPPDCGGVRWARGVNLRILASTPGGVPYSLAVTWLKEPTAPPGANIVLSSTSDRLAAMSGVLLKTSGGPTSIYTRRDLPCWADRTIEPTQHPAGYRSQLTIDGSLIKPEDVRAVELLALTLRRFEPDEEWTAPLWMSIQSLLDRGQVEGEEVMLLDESFHLHRSLYTHRAPEAIFLLKEHRPFPGTVAAARSNPLSLAVERIRNLCRVQGPVIEPLVDQLRDPDAQSITQHALSLLRRKGTFPQSLYLNTAELDDDLLVFVSLKPSTERLIPSLLSPGDEPR